MATAAPSNAELELELIADIARFERDPYGYVLFAFPWGEPGTELEGITGPRVWQVRVLKQIGERLQAGATMEEAMLPIQMARCSGHGIGKSALIGMLTKWALDTMEDAKVVITANTEKQLQTKTSPEIAKWHRLSITSHWFTASVTSLKSTDPQHESSWRADLIPWSEHNTEAFAGLHNKGKRIVLLMDEGSAIADRVWEVAEGALTDADTQILWLVFGNGTRATGRFRECFRKFKHRWDHEQIDSRTVEGVNLAQLEKWVADYGEDSDFVKVRVRGMFPSSSAKQFISETDVDAAFGRPIRPENYDFAPKILTCDPAWTGDDFLEIGLRQGLSYEILASIPKNDNDVDIANKLARYEDELDVDAVFIDGGFGTGIVSVGRTLGRDWIIVWFGEKSADVGCLNKRAEMWKAMRDWLKEGGCIPANQELRDDLIGPETVPRMDGKLLLEPKEAMKSRGLPSPGKADALALSFAHPVRKKEHFALAGQRRGSRSVHDWDPLA